MKLVVSLFNFATTFNFALLTHLKPHQARLHQRLQVLLEAGGQAEFSAFKAVAGIEEQLIADRSCANADLNRAKLALMSKNKSFVEEFRRLAALPPTRDFG